MPGNNPTTDLVIMTNMKVIIPGYPAQNAVLLPANIFIQNSDALQLPTTSFPAMNLKSGKQQYKRIGEEWAGTLETIGTYYDRWDTQSITFDVIWAGICADLERVAANLQSNDSLTNSGAFYTVSMAEMTFSDYAKEVDNATVPGLTLVKRDLVCVWNVLPFLV
jgi:hypothetical protein